MKFLGPNLATCQLATWAESAAKLECWLLRLNPGAGGEHLTSQFSWVAAWLLITRVCSVHPAEEPLLLVFYIPLWLSWCVMMVLLMFFCMVSMVLVMWEVAASKFIHNKSLLLLLFYFIIIFSLKYPVYSDFFRWPLCNVPFVDLMKGKWIWSVRRGWKHYWWQLLRRRKQSWPRR